MEKEVVQQRELTAEEYAIRSVYSLIKERVNGSVRVEWRDKSEYTGLRVRIKYLCFDFLMEYSTSFEKLVQEPGERYKIANQVIADYTKQIMEAVLR